MGWEDVDMHVMMLADEVRTTAFERALLELVRPGMTVLDFGCGTGILSFFARRAGAEHVYAVDSSPIIRVAEALARENGIDGISFVRASKDGFDLPGKVDLIVSECLGYYLFTDQMLDAVFAARDRWLKPGGIMVPSTVRLKAALVPRRPQQATLDYFGKARYGLTFDRLRTLALARRRRIDRLEVTASCSMGVVDFGTARTEPRTTSGVLQLGAPVLAHGLGGWFEADLSPKLTLDTGPDAPPTCWGQSYFPFPEPAPFDQGEVRLRIDPIQLRQTRFRWSAESGKQRAEGDDLLPMTLLGVPGGECGVERWQRA